MYFLFVSFVCCVCVCWEGGGILFCFVVVTVLIFKNYFFPMICSKRESVIEILLPVVCLSQPDDLSVALSVFCLGLCDAGSVCLSVCLPLSLCLSLSPLSLSPSLSLSLTRARDEPDSVYTETIF